MGSCHFAECSQVKHTIIIVTYSVFISSWILLNFFKLDILASFTTNLLLKGHFIWFKIILFYIILLIVAFCDCDCLGRVIGNDHWANWIQSWDVALFKKIFKYFRVILKSCIRLVNNSLSLSIDIRVFISSGCRSALSFIVFILWLVIIIKSKSSIWEYVIALSISAVWIHNLFLLDSCCCPIFKFHLIIILNFSSYKFYFRSWFKCCLFLINNIINFFNFYRLRLIKCLNIFQYIILLLECYMIIWHILGKL